MVPIYRDFKIYDAVVNENATKQQYHWLKEKKNRAARAARISSSYFRGILYHNDVRSREAYKSESSILYFNFETARTVLFLGYLAHTVRRDRKTYGSSKLYFEVTFSSTSLS